MNPNSFSRRLLRRGAPVAVAAAIGAGAGAGAYALTSGSSPSATGTATTVTTVVPAQPAAQTQTVGSLTQLYKDATPGVVDITVDSSSAGSFGFGPGGGQETQAEGTGFMIDTKGDIVTNEHVVDGATSIKVRFKDGSTTKAKLVGTDKSTDIAVIKVDVPAAKIHPLTLGDSSTVLPGQPVVAIGSPYGLAESMTAGIVSAIDRTITAPNHFSISGAIQTDAAINHGNSGGPLIDATSGRVIGVDAQIQSDSGDNSGVGFAIPIDAAKTVAQALISGRTVEHAYLGVSIADASSEQGASVGCVVAGGPADKAGLKAGDVITALDSNPITSANDLTSSLASRLPGDKVTLTVDRNGSTKSLPVTLGDRPANASPSCS